jgi:hypothetical protein
VLALANKEQRGYITPQEFNLFANQAQLEILDSYILDIDRASMTRGNETEYSDMSNFLNEKLGVFKTSVDLGASNVHVLPIDLYQLGSIFTGDNREVDQLTDSEFSKIMNSQFTIQNNIRPAAVIQNNSITIAPPLAIRLTYIRRPLSVSWGYVVVNKKALYDPNVTKTQNFELHASEETELVYKILKLSGIAMQRQEIAQFAQGMEQAIKQ